jgi:hypothetical protein
MFRIAPAVNMQLTYNFKQLGKNTNPDICQQQVDYQFITINPFIVPVFCRQIRR